MEPLHSWLTVAHPKEEEIALLPEVRNWYGSNFILPASGATRPTVFSNFVASLDGRVSLGQPGHTGGGDISGHSQVDRRVMGLARAVSSSVLVGAATLRVEPKHVWSAEHLLSRDPEALALLSRQRQALGRPERALHFFVTGSGHVRNGGDPVPAVLDTSVADVWFLTTEQGAKTLRGQFPDHSLNVLCFGKDRKVDLVAALATVRRDFQVEYLLCEGGPTLIGSLLQKNLLDSEMRTTAPHIVGNATSPEAKDRPTAVSNFYRRDGETLWGKLVSLKTDPRDAYVFSQYQY